MKADRFRKIIFIVAWLVIWQVISLIVDNKILLAGPYETWKALIALSVTGLTALPEPPRSICIMVQREAAERIMSAPGSKQWCALAAELQYYGQPRVLGEVPAEAFDPPPHVTSCFIRIDRHEAPIVAPKDEQLYRRLIRAAFAMRRKTLANNLKAAFGLDQQAAKAVLAAAGLDERVRGESLSHGELCRVADALHEAGR